jgi:hypothetical protein
MPFCGFLQVVSCLVNNTQQLYFCVLF